MNENAQKLNAVVAALLIVASVLGLAVLGRSRSGSPRPPQTASDSRAADGIQTIPNRLWQDPFEAFEKISSTNKPVGLAERCSRQARFTTVLAVFLEGSPYPEDKEVRRRLRYAVEVALLTSDFAPEDRKHIGVEQMKFTGADLNGEQKVAFEWFARTKGSQDVLVLWLPEEDFARGPLTRIKNLWTTLGLSPSRSELVVLGPRSSDTLRSMAREWSSDLVPLYAQSIRIVSPHATAPDSELFPEFTNSVRRVQLQEKFSGYADLIRFDSWIASDWQLCQRIAEELQLRGIGRKSDASDVVVLISEADTFYGRSLPATMESALSQSGFPTNSVWHFKYLRGLEGIKPAKPTSEETPIKLPSSPEAVLQAALTKKGERSEGESQQDYARRFASFLKKQERHYSWSGPRIRAIGLTGSDFYDKLVLLQALRSHFPEAVFFTTDLDAGYWTNPEQLNYTRNLLVASSYGLDPEPSAMSTQFMPFRDVYQAATFAACRAAVAINQATAPEENLRGAVFEIGRHGPVKLKPSAASGTQTAAAGASKASFSTSLVYLALIGALVLVTSFFTLILRHPPRLDAIAESHRHTQRAKPRVLESPVQVTVASGLGQRRYETKDFLTGVPAPRGGAAGLQDLSEPEHPEERQGAGISAPRAPGGKLQPVSKSPISRWFRTLWYCAPGLGAIAAGAVFLAGAALSQYIASLGGQEPWSFTDGVSIWPTEAIRVVAIVLALRFLVSAFLGEKAHQEQFWRTHFQPERGAKLDVPSDDKSAPLYDRVAFDSWHQQVEASHKQGTLHATSLFQGYAALGQPWKRAVRLSVNVAALLVGLTLVSLLLGGMPLRSCVRGDASRMLDICVLMLAVAGFFAVLFYAIDATRLAARLLTYLEQPTVWPGWRKQEIANRECLSSDDTDPVLDMKLAVDLTHYVRSFMLCPFILLLLMLVSRLSVFEAWTWPLPLAGVFVLNFMLAATGWAVLRRSAYRVRAVALKQLTDRAVYYEHAELSRFREESAAGLTARWIQSGSGDYSPEKYAKRLREVIDSIKSERRGAFAPWIQDPTYLFLFIPTGITGILTVALHFLLN